MKYIRIHTDALSELSQPMKEIKRKEVSEKEKDSFSKKMDKYNSLKKNPKKILSEKTPKKLNKSDSQKEEMQIKLPKYFHDLSKKDQQKQIEALNRMSEPDKNIYLKTIEKEPEITKDIQDIVERNSGKLEGLNCRIKTPSSLCEKLYERENKVNINEIKDIIRYTAIYSPNKLAKGTNACLKDLESRDYQIIRVKDTWNEKNAVYKGINVSLINPKGQVFELQFHTMESFNLKNGELHSIYEKRRALPDDAPEVAELEEKMIKLSSEIEKPDNIDEVKNR